MASAIVVDGVVIQRPTVVTKIDASALSAVGPSAGRIVALLGTGVGGRPVSANMKPEDLISLVDEPSARKVLRSGDLREGAVIAFTPSVDEEIPGGAQRVIAMKVNQATQSTRTRFTGDVSSLVETSEDYGAFTEQISTLHEGGTDPDTRQVTATFEDVVENADNIGGQSYFDLRYRDSVGNGWDNVAAQVLASGIRVNAGRREVGLDGDVDALSANSAVRVSSSTGDTRVVTIYGLDADGDPQLETLALNGVNLVLGVKIWSRVFGASVPEAYATGAVLVEETTGSNIDLFTLSDPDLAVGVALGSAMYVAKSKVRVRGSRGDVTSKAVPIWGKDYTGVLASELVTTDTLVGTEPVETATRWSEITAIGLEDIPTDRHIHISGIAAETTNAVQNTLQKAADYFNARQVDSGDPDAPDGFQAVVQVANPLFKVENLDLTQTEVVAGGDLLSGSTATRDIATTDALVTSNVIALTVASGHGAVVGELAVLADLTTGFNIATPTPISATGATSISIPLVHANGAPGDVVGTVTLYDPTQVAPSGEDCLTATLSIKADLYAVLSFYANASQLVDAVRADFSPKTVEITITAQSSHQYVIFLDGHGFVVTSDASATQPEVQTLIINRIARDHRLNGRWTAALLGTTQVLLSTVSPVNHDVSSPDTNLAVATTANAEGSGVPPDPDTQPQFLVGGEEGTATADDYQTAFDVLRRLRHVVRVNSVVPLTGDPAVHAKLLTHLRYCAGVKGRAEADGFIGLSALDDDDAPTNELPDDASIKAQIKALNTRHIRACAQNMTRFNTAGEKTVFAPWFRAAMFAGMQAGSPTGTPLTNKQTNELDFDQDVSWNPSDNDEDMIRLGLMFVDRRDGAIRVVRNITTYTVDDNLAFVEGSMNETLNEIAFESRRRVEPKLGKRATKNLKGLAGQAIIKYLNSISGENGLIEGYDPKKIFIRRVGDAIEIDFGVIMPPPVNFFVITIRPELPAV